MIIQSKTGAVWSVDAIGNTVFTSVMEFRLSGKGDRFFGDGLVSEWPLSSKSCVKAAKYAPGCVCFAAQLRAHELAYAYFSV